MIVLMVVESMLSATTTWLVINAGRRVAVGEFLITDLLWILTTQSIAYVIGVVSWVFAERAGYRGFGKYMLRFARENRGKVKLLNDKPTREQIEPFLTGETYQVFFSVMYELEFALKLMLGLTFNALVLGAEIDASLPFAYVGAFIALLLMQWALQTPIAQAYLENQRRNNRITAQGYTALGQCFRRQSLQSSALARGLQDPAARGPDRADPRHRRARRHERDERHRQPGDHLRHHHLGGDAQCRQYRAPGRARDHAAAADRHELRVASVGDRLERFHRHLDALRRGRRQYAAGARSGVRRAHQIRQARSA